VQIHTSPLKKTTYTCIPKQTNKLIPKFRGPYVIKKVLDRDRYIVGDIEGFQVTQRPYEGIVGPDRIKRWVK
jgi:hypothetical protein